jgi:hypothetical protein
MMGMIASLEDRILEGAVYAAPERLGFDPRCGHVFVLRQTAIVSRNPAYMAMFGGLDLFADDGDIATVGSLTIYFATDERVKARLEGYEFNEFSAAIDAVADGYGG